MALFDGFRRKRDEPATALEEQEPGKPLTDEDPVDGPVTWYRKMYVSVAPAGEDVLLHDPERTTPVVLPAFELDLLEQCSHFAPIEEHAAIAARRSGLPADGLAPRLYELVDRGLLISQQEVVDRARAASRGQEPAPALNRVAVITGNRPQSLAICLQSYRERYGRDLELIVFDDSADPAVREENRRAAARSGAGGPILYAGEDEKRRLVSALARKSGVEEDIVRAAVSEFDGVAWHTGANRNAALLDAAGGTVLMVDDDTTARAASPPATSNDDFRLSSRHDPWSLRLFARVEDALDAAEWQDVDLLELHRRYLGRSPAACAFTVSAAAASPSLDGHAARMHLNDADSILLSGFCAARGKVVASSAGIVGDSGMSSSLYFLLLRGEARERLLEDYAAHRATRAVQRCADVATVSNSRFLMTPHVAFDVRTTIPPFSPVLRNEDAVFGDLLRTCSPESYLAFLPWAVEHRPPVARALEFDQVLRAVGRVGANTMICELARAYEPGMGVANPVVRLRAFGQYLIALGTMPPAEFDGFVRSQITEAIGRRIDQLTNAVNREGGQPEDWAKDCSAAVSAALRAVTEDAGVISDVPGATTDEIHRRFQRLLVRFGRLLDAWPALLDAAADLRMAEPIKA